MFMHQFLNLNRWGMLFKKTNKQKILHLPCPVEYENLVDVLIYSSPVSFNLSSIICSDFPEKLVKTYSANDWAVKGLPCSLWWEYGGRGEVELLWQQWLMRDGAWRQADGNSILTCLSTPRCAVHGGDGGKRGTPLCLSEISCCWLTILRRSLFGRAAGGGPDVQRRRRARLLTHSFESQKGNLRSNPVGQGEQNVRAAMTRKW